MKKASTPRIVAVLVAFGFVGALVLTPLAMPEPQLRVAVVDLQRLFDNLEEKVDMNVELRLLQEKANQAIQQLAQRAKKLEDQLKFFQKESEKRKELEKQLTELKTRARVRIQEEDKKITQKTIEFTRRIYKKMTEEISDYARRKGYSLILKVQKPELPREGRLDQINRLIAERIVLFSGGVPDITDEVRDIMNRKYLASKAKK